MWVRTLAAAAEEREWWKERGWGREGGREGGRERASEGGRGRERYRYR